MTTTKLVSSGPNDCQVLRTLPTWVRPPRRQRRREQYPRLGEQSFGLDALIHHGRAPPAVHPTALALTRRPGRATVRPPCPVAPSRPNPRNRRRPHEPVAPHPPRGRPGLGRPRRRTARRP